MHPTDDARQSHQPAAPAPVTGAAPGTPPIGRCDDRATTGPTPDHPSVTTDHVHLRIPLDHPEVPSECVWAVPLGGGRYRIANVPFLVHHVGLGDVVAAVEVEPGELELVDVIEHIHVASFSYELPFGKGKALLASLPAWMDHVVGGYVLAGTFTRQSGWPGVVYLGNNGWWTSKTRPLGTSS